MAKTETDPNAPAEEKKGKAKPKLVKVRVKGKQPVGENGEIYHPARQVPNGAGGLKEIPADTFEVTEERAEALGEYVELVG